VHVSHMALFLVFVLGVPHLKHPASSQLAMDPSGARSSPKSKKDGPDTWLESPPSPPVAPPVPPARPHGCDISDIYCKNATKAGQHDNDPTKLAVHGQGHHDGAAKKKEKKHIKALEKMKEAHDKIKAHKAENKGNGLKKLKKKLKVQEKKAAKKKDAKDRQKAAAEWKSHKDDPAQA